jgi:G:T/U-mismatch repair DNA glycosylase
MKKSRLTPFLRSNLEILFIGLNPAKGSNENGHYFSVKQAFWEQLFKSGLINQNIDKLVADEMIFGSANSNYNNWNFGITDLITEIAESDSKKINPTKDDLIILEKQIRQLKPITAVILHKKVLKKFTSHLELGPLKSNTGKIGKIIPGCNTTFFNIAFPHGNAITNESKIKKYIELKEFLISIKTK